MEEEWDMPRGRRRHSLAFKAEVALEAVKDEWTEALLVAKYAVHPGQIQAWKKAFLEGEASVFDGKQSNGQKGESVLVARLYPPA